MGTCNFPIFPWLFLREAESRNIGNGESCEVVFSPSMWLETLLSAAGVVRDLSYSFACPAHCGFSFLIPFVAGVSLGCLLGLCLAAHLLYLFYPIAQQPPAPVFEPASEAPVRRPAPRTQNRLARYLHE